jgi:hypothetical protein
MKIYNEVVIDMNTGETIYEDSFEYNGEMALCYCGTYKGSDKLGEADDKVGEAGQETMELLLNQFEGMKGENSFLSKEKVRIQADLEAQKDDAKDNFLLKQKQAQGAFQLTSGQGQQSYKSSLGEIQADMNRTREKAVDQQESTRAQAADASYGNMSAGGMAGGSGRGRKTLGANLKRTMGSMALDLKQAKDKSGEQMASAEQKMNQDRTSGAVNLQQNIDTSEQGMNQQRGALDRQWLAEEARLDQERSQGLDRIRMEASGVVGSTVASFQNSNSTWNMKTDGFDDWGVDTYFPLPTT